MVIAVADLDGSLLALYRMQDATVFSIDVAVGKARNMVYFNSSAVNPADLPGVPVGTAVTNRTISFGAQPLFPSGINGSSPGPFFQLYVNDVNKPCTQGSPPANANQNGIVFFPGSEGLYRNGTLVGGLGISGDGVEQGQAQRAADLLHRVDESAGHNGVMGGHADQRGAAHRDEGETQSDAHQDLGG